VATGRYFVTGDVGTREKRYKTVVVDEASMLTEDQLAALLDGLDGVERCVLVGDIRQLPPIGAGRPLVDIVHYLSPANFESLTPRTAPAIAELTVLRRQNIEQRDDVALATGFGGANADPTFDEVFERVCAGESKDVSVVSWRTHGQLHALLLERIAEELG